MIASLGMYDLPWLRAANDRLWAAMVTRLRAAGIEDVPDDLTRDGDLDDIWRSPRLLLSQTCGYPLMMELRESVQLIATPRYRAEGCQGAEHRSAIIVRRGDSARTIADLRGRRVGINGLRSNSGMNLFRAAIAPCAGGELFFGKVVLTGSHARSLAGVLSGRIDVAAVDAVTLAHLRRHYPRRAEAIRILTWTPPSPGLPLVTSAETPARTVAALRNALASIAASPDLREVLDALLIEGFETLGLDDYRPVIALADQAAEQAYPVLA